MKVSNFWCERIILSSSTTSLSHFINHAARLLGMYVLNSCFDPVSSNVRRIFVSNREIAFSIGVGRRARKIAAMKINEI